jgi:DNA-binding MarR family transcriptional regulator
METALDDPVLAEIGIALFHLRRVWAKPDLMRKVREQTPGSRPLQMSNLMVVSAVNRLGAGAGAEVTVGAVADRLEIDPSTASRLVGHAIDAGFISRRPSPADARRANLQLTDAGRRVMEAAERHRHTYIMQLMADWPAQDRTEFARLLSKFAQAATQDPLDFSKIGEIFEEAAEG